MTDVITYTKDYNIDLELSKSESSVDALRAAQLGLVHFLQFAKTMDSEIKDEVLQTAQNEGNDFINGFYEIRVLLDEFIERLEKTATIEKESIPSSDSVLAIVQREVNLTVFHKTHQYTGRVGEIIRGAKRSDGEEFIKLQADFGNYFWNDDLDNWNKDISIDPQVEARWVSEGEYLNG